MYLKNLTILGFKSFADKTSLDFPPGITAIVGPNGCGKSNVADSIRWVLGEQSAKALRGGEMSDIIFNGTETRRPLSMAEVSLTICDVDQEQLRAANLELLFNEVTVTRRIYRDGSNEYFLNKTPCRLKDIQQLFLGTGVGRTSYSIMAQGHITQILSSRPEDRRMIFEEAAGITRFKVQKKEALRKLDQTENNLLRLSDMITEVKRHIGSLQRQAGKARRYKSLSEDLRFLETHYNRHLYDKVSGELAERIEESNTLDNEINQRNLDIQSSEERINQSRQQLSELEQAIAEQQKTSLETKAQVDSFRSNIEFNQERIRETVARSEAANGEILAATEKKLTAGQELEQLTQTVQTTMRELESTRATLRERTEAVQSVEATLIAKQTAVRNVQNQLFALTQKLTRTRGEINSLDIQKQGNVVRLEKLNAEITQNQTETEQLRKRIEEFTQTAESDKQISDEKRMLLQKTQSELQKLQSEASTLSGKQDELYRQMATRKSRLNVLEQLQSSREGFGAGALAALKQDREVLGALVDRLRIPSEYISAIEILLGTNLQLVLAAQPQAVQSILDNLKKSQKGLASVAPLTWDVGEAQPNTNPLSFADLPADLPKPIRVLDIVQAEESVSRILQRLLGHSWIVPNLEIAAALWSQNPGQIEFVTAGGEVLTRDGVFIGGSRKESSAATSILGRKNEIAKLAKQVQELESDAAVLKSEREQLQQRQKEGQEGLLKIQSEIRSHEMAVATRLGEFRVLQNSLRMLSQKHDSLNKEMVNLSAQNSESETKRQILSDQIGKLEQEEKNASDNIGEINATIDQLRQQRDAEHASLTEIKIALASKEQYCNAHRLQKTATENRLAELGRLIEVRTKEIEESQKRTAEYNGKITEASLQIETLSAKHAQLNQKIADLTQQKKTLTTDVETQETRLKELRAALHRAQERHEALNVQITQRQMILQNIGTRMQEKYQLDILSIVPESFSIEESENGIKINKPQTDAATSQVTTADFEPAPAVQLPPIDWETVSQMVTQLQERIDQLGPVNLVAIEEYEETEQRYKFLTGQQDDLVEAKRQLLEVVSKINQETKVMFKETFEKIRINFRSMFDTFFHGGFADLKLVDERDVLESGIEIVARPRGKQLKSVSLLSGGEQTMTAVALLFAIYQVRPSPFCVLDELDAPLDEANVSRFVEVLKKFVDFSQFIVITHSKQSIAAANSIHGVTMPEHGVTKMISMKFREGSDELEKVPS